jgi:hypothetical protein
VGTAGRPLRLPPLQAFTGSLTVAEPQNIDVRLERTTAEEQQAEMRAAEEERRRSQRAAQQQAQQALERPRTSNEKAPRKRFEDAHPTLIRSCEDMVRSLLKAPRSAKFPRAIFKLDFVKDYPSEGYSTYRARVDAKNSFGAMICSDFMCRYTASSNTVSLEFFE